MGVGVWWGEGAGVWWSGGGSGGEGVGCKGLYRLVSDRMTDERDKELIVPHRSVGHYSWK